MKRAFQVNKLRTNATKVLLGLFHRSS
jgi:hypothetical protein